MGSLVIESPSGVAMRPPDEYLEIWGSVTKGFRKYCLGTSLGVTDKLIGTGTIYPRLSFTAGPVHVLSFLEGEIDTWNVNDGRVFCIS